MHHRVRSITWRGQTYHFEQMYPKGSGGETSLWAVSHEQELIGTMPCGFEVTAKEFEARGRRWLREHLE